jgi:hypothetical protein
MSGWDKWFAWYPVDTGYKNREWLVNVWRCGLPLGRTGCAYLPSNITEEYIKQKLVQQKLEGLITSKDIGYRSYDVSCLTSFLQVILFLSPVYLPVFILFPFMHFQ